MTFTLSPVAREAMIRYHTLFLEADAGQTTETVIEETIAFVERQRDALRRHIPSHLIQSRLEDWRNFDTSIIDFMTQAQLQRYYYAEAYVTVSQLLCAANMDADGPERKNYFAQTLARSFRESTTSHYANMVKREVLDRLHIRQLAAYVCYL